MSETPRKVIHLPKVRMLSRGGRLATGLRITNVKSIRPPDPDALKKQEEEKLRAQLQEEIVSRSRSCAYKGGECNLPVLSGRLYCYRHILRDGSAPYRQCTHTFPNGERCTFPAPLESNDPRDPGLCFEHASAAMLARQRQAAPPRPVVSTETLLTQLDHYVKTERPRTTSCASSVSVVSDPSDQEQASPAALDPFKEIEAPAVNAAYSASILEWCSGSESDADSVTLGPEGTSKAVPEDMISDAEDAAVEEQPLWKAGIYTAEEAVREAKNALVMLKDGYLNQMERLKVLLQSARAQYIKDLKAEKEQHCSINAQARNGSVSTRERRQLRKLKAYASYHKKHGIDAVLSRRVSHRKAKLSESQSRPPPSLARCTFSEGGVRCEQHVLPAAKHCRRHILHDPHQVLFTSCGDSRGVASCSEPVPKTPLPAAKCRYHTDPPLYTVFTLKKDESDSDSDSSSTDESHSDLPESVGDKSDALMDVNEAVHVQ